ncbi:MAG: PLP-dependent lyase/thiolase [archaeon]
MIEVGHTPLLKISYLNKKFNLPNLWIKDESKNPFGTFKDRRSELIIKNAKENNIDKLALITAGNSGYSLAKFSEGTGIKVVSIVDKKCRNSIKEKLKKYCGKLIEADLAEKMFKPEEITLLARENNEEKILDATNRWHKANEQIIFELKKEYLKKLDCIICPLGSGELFLGIHSALKKLKMKVKIVCVGVNSSKSVADKLITCWRPYSKEINDALKKGNKYIEVKDEEILSAMKSVEGLINCEPSAATVFAALPKLKLNKETRILAINTGKGLI